MTNAEKVLSLKVRINKLEGKEINHKCPGVLRKLKRQLRNYETLVFMEK